MFKPRKSPLTGKHFDAAYRDLKGHAAASYARLEDIVQVTAPLKWEDELTDIQMEKYWWVESDGSTWKECYPALKAEIEEVPVVSLAVVEDDGHVEYVMLGTMGGSVVIFAYQKVGGGVKLPSAVEAWLQSNRVAVLTTGLYPFVNLAKLGIAVNNRVEAANLYAAAQNAGVIRSKERGPGSVKWMLTYSVEYHHQADSAAAMERMLGSYKYPIHPYYRSEGWCILGRSAPSSSWERFYTYYEAQAPLLLVNRLLRHSLIYGGLPHVNRDAPFADLCYDFVCGKPPSRSGASSSKSASTNSAQCAAVSAARTIQGHASAPAQDNNNNDSPQNSVPSLRIKREPLEAAEEGAVGQPDPPAEPGQAEDGGDGGDVPLVDLTIERERPPTPPGRGSSPSVQQSLLVMSGTVAGTNINLGSGQAPCAIHITTGDGPLSPGEPGPQPPADPAVFRSMARTTAAAWANFRGPGRGGEGDAEPEVERSFQAADRRTRRQAQDLAQAFRDDPSAGYEAVRPRQDDNLRHVRDQTVKRNAEGFARRHPAVAQPLPARGQVLPISQRDLDHHKLTRDQHREMAYACRPLLNRKCSFCGRNYCSKRSRTSERLACNLYEDHLHDAPTRRLCDYRRCADGREHHTSVCETMHTRCHKCGTRGHDGGCRPDDARMMEAYRSDFEEWAKVGVYTKDRTHDLAWGWYPYPRGVKRDESNPILSYDRLTDLPVFEALRLMADTCALPANQEAGPAEPSQGRGSPT